ncbi:MAG: HAD-IA family hydrolase [Alphaproteobacteria bacterium]|nr:HAD-IA family hydrolase [Alphaproteobacteria bacterium]
MSGGLRFIVFDCDGTLVDSLARIHIAMEGAFLREGLEAPALSAVKAVIGLNLEDAVARVAGERAPDAAARARLCEAYRACYGAVPTDRAAWPLYPGAREVVETLHAEGFALGVATGKSRRGLARVLEEHALADRFSVLLTADDGPGKPHPFILEDAMSEAGVAPHETVVIGDTSFDMEMARAAGAGAIGVGWGYHSESELRAAGAHALVQAFPEILPLARGGRSVIEGAGSAVR